MLNTQPHYHGNFIVVLVLFGRVYCFLVWYSLRDVATFIEIMVVMLDKCLFVEMRWVGLRCE